MHCFRIGVEKGMKLCTAVQEGCGYKDTLSSHRYFAPPAKYFTVCITYQLPLVNSNLTFRGLCIVKYSYNKTTEMHQFLKFILGIKLYTFQTVSLSIIRSIVLYTQQ